MTTQAFTPYTQEAPQTTDLRALRAELTRVRATHGRGSSQGLEAYQRLAVAAAAQGQPLDGLRRQVWDEAERYFAQTIQGPDGHVYWDGPHRFVRNDKAMRKPARWWWEHRNGPLEQSDSVAPTCGEHGCINPEHSVRVTRTDRRGFTDAQLRGLLQALALRLGRSPMMVDYRAAGLRPMDSVIRARFGGWDGALRAAGLEIPARRGEVSATTCLRSIRRAREILNRWPTTHDLRAAWLRERLRAEGLPTSPDTIKLRVAGGWADVLRAAGKP